MDDAINALTQRIIGCAIEVHRALGPGLLERTYEAALAIELRQHHLPFARQVPVPILYRGEWVGDYRLDLALKMGASRAVNASRTPLAAVMQELKMAEGFDVGLEMSGSPEAFRDMLAAMHHGGGIAQLGFLPPETRIDWDQVIFKGLTLNGIYGREIFRTWHRMSQLIGSGLDIAPVITHRFPAGEYQQAFEVARSGQCGKVILEWAS